MEVERKVAKVSFIAVDDKLKGNLRKQNKKWEKYIDRRKWRLLDFCGTSGIEEGWKPETL